MGASESKLEFRKAFLSLAQKDFKLDDNEDWVASFCSSGLTVDEIYSVLGASNIRELRDGNLENLLKLIAKLIDKLFVFLSAKNAVTVEQVLGSIRLLTRLLPFIFEKDNLIEENFFWKSFDGSCPLGDKLAEAVVDLAFVPEFSIPALSDQHVCYTVWEQGIGCQTKKTSPGNIISNRMEVLRLMLVLMARSMYVPSNCLSINVNRFLVFFTSRLDRNASLSLTFSLLNVVSNYNPTGWLPYNHVFFSDFQDSYVVTCSHCLVCLLDFVMPDCASEKNDFRLILSKISKEEDLNYLLDCLINLSRNPLDSHLSMLPNSAKAIEFFPEVLMILWKILEINKKALSILLADDKCLKLLVNVMFYFNKARTDPSLMGLLHLCSFILLLLSAERSFSVRLNKAYDGPTAFLPISNFEGNYSDFLLLFISQHFSSSKSYPSNLNECLLTVACNISPYLKSLHSSTCHRFVTSFEKLSEVFFINQSNFRLFCLLLEFFNNLVVYQFDRNPHFIYCILRSKETFEKLKDLKYENCLIEIKKMASLDGSTEKQLDEVKSSCHLGNLLRLLNILIPEIQRLSSSQEAFYEQDVLDYLNSGTLVGLLPSPPPISVRKYESNEGISLWFSSYIFGIIYLRNSNPAIWYGTAVKLFQVKSGLDEE